MPRWEPDATSRLTTAALELFEEHGFAATTVPQIADRAGLTTRTFFRHFADKREVLFADAADLTWLGPTLDRVSDDTPPIDLVGELVNRVAEAQFSGRRDHVARVRAIVAADASLRERSHTKRHLLTEQLATALGDRGRDTRSARLIAELAATVLELAIEQWLSTPATGREHRALATHIQDALDAHTMLFAPS
ncbi:TetR/AcrR family transcriptional regulator [Homoserinibacter sp. YIM 151385]|uniref:TetR/AcrR family transcriptional regulator n=1 Tax=Homoserinibacter sp. YIM 151385 TaxID=2985506 RepID=UPI0022F14500|nr:TetR/AcrR family transcriptional regulator [Homoserinibacter sp. YIM 151385]WBU38022.1 TetR/AcrR family transcriptional regulator [Homoserinibacter sp. YIM 151385]